MAVCGCKQGRQTKRRGEVNDPALLSAALISVDAAISGLMRMRIALEEMDWEQENAPEPHEEAQGLELFRLTFVSSEAG